MTISTPLMFVTLQQASDHLRRDQTDDNDDLTDKIVAASSIVLNYIGDGVDDFINSSNVDTAGDPIIPGAVQAATLIMVGILYDKVRSGDGINPQFTEHGYLPYSVMALLYPYRTPTVS